MKDFESWMKDPKAANDNYETSDEAVKQQALRAIERLSEQTYAHEAAILALALGRQDLLAENAKNYAIMYTNRPALSTLNNNDALKDRLHAGLVLASIGSAEQNKYYTALFKKMLKERGLDDEHFDVGNDISDKIRILVELLPSNLNHEAYLRNEEEVDDPESIREAREIFWKTFESIRPPIT